jgi:hypothetical protein
MSTTEANLMMWLLFSALTAMLSPTVVQFSADASTGLAERIILSLVVGAIAVAIVNYIQSEG